MLTDLPPRKLRQRRHNPKLDLEDLTHRYSPFPPRSLHSPFYGFVTSITRAHD
jgi:hypothetical protein